MAIYKKIHFHQLSVYKKEVIKTDKQSDLMSPDYLKVSEINSLWDDIIENQTLNNCIRIQEENDPDLTTLEILKSNKEYIFGRIGKEKDMRAYHLREEGTFKPEQIPKRDDQIFEIFTYILIDRDTMIISYLYEMTAPSILKIGELITNLYRERDIFGEVAAVSIEDAIPFLSKKDNIGTITYKITLPPSDSRLWNEGITGLDRNTYESIESLKHVEFTVKLVAERNKDTFPDKGVFASTLRRISGIASRVKVKAKNKDEYTQDHDLINNPLTKKVKFEFNKELFNIKQVQEDIYRSMLKKYMENKSEILEYCKIS